MKLAQLRGEWQPIETAPRDGTCVLLYRPEIIFSGYYGGAHAGWRHNAPTSPAMYPKPTHWMPLPCFPEKERTYQQEMWEETKHLRP